jgi:hypothetical protein
MERKTVCLMLLIMMISTNTAFASNWSFVGRTSKEDPLNLIGATYNEYIEKNTARKNGDSLIFWNKQQFDKDDEDSGEMILTQNEVTLSMQKTRILESIEYDYNGKVTSRDKEPSGWSQYQKGSQFERKILIALKYAKEGKGTGVSPEP